MVIHPFIYTSKKSNNIKFIEVSEECSSRSASKENEIYRKFKSRFRSTFFRKIKCRFRCTFFRQKNVHLNLLLNFDTEMLKTLLLPLV